MEGYFVLGIVLEQLVHDLNVDIKSGWLISAIK